MTEKNDNTEQMPLVLIVDDDRTMRALLNLGMEEEGYRIVEAKNGEQCLSEYVHLQPDLILLDAVMPDLDGFTCCQKIRSLPGGDRVPILIITVLDDRESIERAFQAGATDYITKPINWEVMARRVDRLLSTNQASLELAAVKEQLKQQQAWEELIRKILQQLAQGNLVEDSIKQVLSLIRNWSQASRVLLYIAATKNCFESLAVGTPSITEFSALDFNLLSEYGEQYHQGKIVVIEDIAGANLPSAAIARFEQLNTQALSIVPLRNGTSLLGLLSLHSSERFSQWQKLTVNRFIDLGRLLTIELE
ncbi:PleD family two-component system response regulator [Myxosarcina sp. GI1]|uniref:response regulator n=1 Tax=Myxosarcina sp. GI1 TaxID=1541065 RepID=UPI00068E87A3|nr:response regulator [Myxosarcina sp. GI1]